MAFDTKKEQVEEIKKCAKNPIYFIKSYLYIQHPIRGRLPFSLYPFQEDCIYDFIKFKQNIILKSRQLGLSTTAAAYSLWQALFSRDQNILIMATKLDVGKFMVQKVRTMFSMLPAWMLDLLQLTTPATDSVKYVSFNNGSRITAIPTSADAGRGEAVSLLIIDEAAHIDNLKELWTGLQPTMSTGGRVIMFSSPKGKGNYFHELWLAATDTHNLVDCPDGATRGDKPGTNGFHPIKLPWTVHPERDEKWFDEQTKSLDIRGIAQELLCSFESSGQTFFNPVQIDAVKAAAEHPAMFSGPPGNPTDLWVWRSPAANHDYLICADVARGDSEDFSAFHVVDMTSNEVAAEYLGKIPTDEFGVYLVDVGKRFNMAQIVQEKNTYGVACANVLKTLKYPNLYYDADLKERMLYMTPEEQARQIPGFTTTVKNRESLLQNLEEVIRNKRIGIYSTRFGDEMDHFIWTGKRGQALKRKHDDLIMALAIGLQVYTPNGNRSTSNEGMAWHMAFLKGISRTSTKMSTQMHNYGKNDANQGRKNPETYMGKELKPGVRREHVELEQMMRNEFDWLFR